VPHPVPVLLPAPSRRGRPVLLAVAHGSRDPRAAAALDRLTERVRRLDAECDIRLSYVDHTTPSLGQALAEVAEQGQSAAVVPLLLSAAAHSKGDIPGSILAARATYPTLRIGYGRVLGPHPLLLEALQHQLAVAGAPDDAAVVLAGTGSADPAANAEVAGLARLLWEVRGGSPVDVAYASATSPTVPEAIARLDRLGHDRVAVASYFLAPGRLLDAVIAAAPGTTVTEPLADTEAVARLVHERYAEALAGTAAMNCDCCVYRTTWPGHEHRVGQPQRPHPHPAELS